MFAALVPRHVEPYLHGLLFGDRTYYIFYKIYIFDYLYLYLMRSTRTNQSNGVHPMHQQSLDPGPRHPYRHDSSVSICSLFCIKQFNIKYTHNSTK